MRKALFLGFHRIGHAAKGIPQFRVCVCHETRNDARHLPKKWSLRTLYVTVANGTSEDFAQHVSATLVRRQHSVRNEKGRCSAVICNDSKRRGNKGLVRRYNLAARVLLKDEVGRRCN